MKLNFGKYKGTEISDIQDISYLTWIVNFPNEGNFKISDRIKDEARDVIEKNGEKKPLQEIYDAVEPEEVGSADLEKANILGIMDEIIRHLKDRRQEIAEM